MTTGLVMIHGRSQQTPDSARTNPDLVNAHIDSMQRRWLAGLAKGIVLADLQPLDTATPVFTAFYADIFVDAIAAYIANGGIAPDLEFRRREDGFDVTAQDELVFELAEALGFQPSAHMTSHLPGAGHADEAWNARSQGLEFKWTTLLESSMVHAALSFVARKTGVAEIVIERFLTDVAYYLDIPQIREAVLTAVQAAIEKAGATCDEIVVIGHSLGSIVAYDAFTFLSPRVRVSLLVTPGAPLGLPIVQRNLLPPRQPLPRAVPNVDGHAVPWLNVFDVRDPVALIQPLSGVYDGPVHDERTANPSDPHSIEDYLSDPDVARPIRRALAGKPPW